MIFSSRENERKLSSILAETKKEVEAEIQRKDSEAKEMKEELGKEMAALKRKAELTAEELNLRDRQRTQQQMLQQQQQQQHLTPSSRESALAKEKEKKHVEAEKRKLEEEIVDLKRQLKVSFSVSFGSGESEVVNLTK